MASPASVLVILPALVVAVKLPLPASAPSGEFPAAELPNGHGLVSPLWLRALLRHRDGDGPPPTAWDGTQPVVLEASWGALAQAADSSRTKRWSALPLKIKSFSSQIVYFNRN